MHSFSHQQWSKSKLQASAADHWQWGTNGSAIVFYPTGWIHGKSGIVMEMETGSFRVIQITCWSHYLSKWTWRRGFVSIGGCPLSDTNSASYMKAKYRPLHVLKNVWQKNGCLCISRGMDWRAVQGLLRLSPNASWDRLQPTATLHRTQAGRA